jgi:hypothetical protein
MYDIRADGDKEGVIVVNTPGSVTFTTIPASPIWGSWVVGQTMYVCAGTSLYSVSTSGVVTFIGALPTVARKVSMADNGSELIIVDGITGYICNLTTLAITQIVDANFPAGTTSVTFLNGRFICVVPNSRQFRVGQITNGMSWTPLIFGTKENSSDLLVRVDVLNGVLILWGQLSTEFWQDVGTTPLPYQRINGATQQYGLYALNSVVKINNTICFLGTNPDGGISILMLNGYNAVPISNSDIESIISNFANAADGVALVYHAYGHSVYQISFPSALRTLAYDTVSKVWHEAQTGADLTGRHFAELGVTFAASNLFFDATTGNVYRFDTDVFSDNGSVIRREICTRHVRAAGNELFCSLFYLDMEVGDGSPVVMLEVSRDGGRTFGPVKTLSIGPIGVYLRRFIQRRLGRSRDFVFRISMTDPYRFVITSGSVDLEIADG